MESVGMACVPRGPWSSKLAELQALPRITEAPEDSLPGAVPTSPGLEESQEMNNAKALILKLQLARSYELLDEQARQVAELREAKLKAEKAHAVQLGQAREQLELLAAAVEERGETVRLMQERERRRLEEVAELRRTVAELRTLLEEQRQRAAEAAEAGRAAEAAKEDEAGLAMAEKLEERSQQITALKEELAALRQRQAGVQANSPVLGQRLQLPVRSASPVVSLATPTSSVRFVWEARGASPCTVVRAASPCATMGASPLREKLLELKASPSTPVYAYRSALVPGTAAQVKAQGTATPRTGGSVLLSAGRAQPGASRLSSQGGQAA